MLRILSTYLFVSKKLTPEILKQIAAAGFQAVEIFAARSHFDYATRQEVRATSPRPWPIIACNSFRCMPPQAATSASIAKAASLSPFVKWNASAASKPWMN